MTVQGGKIIQFSLNWAPSNSDRGMVKESRENGGVHLLVLGEKTEPEVAALDETKAPRWATTKEIAEWEAPLVWVTDPEAGAALCYIVHRRPRIL
jgi:hypothetical protein